MLPADVLLEIFDHCRRNELGHGTENPYARYLAHGAWHTLVHVCQRWRQTIFASPRHLALKLRCTNGTPVRKNLNYFPTLPIIIRYGSSFTPGDEDNLFAALELPDRIFYIDIFASNLRLQNIAAEMQQSFPALTVLQLTVVDRVYWTMTALPDGFLGGSAPCLQEISLDGLSFPALPTVLSSANDLVVLRLKNIPWIGYFHVSPEAMVLGLATLTRLETLHIDFESPSPIPGQACLPPETRAVLPALTYFEFRGVWDYLEDLVSRIHCPQLNRIAITVEYVSDNDFRAAQLVEFVNRSDSLQPILFGRVEISCGGSIAFSAEDSHSPASICISCEEFEW
jgi:hypothetical protein